MPKQKDFKRVIRARMRKTGESYTAARIHFLEKPASAEAVSSESRAAAPAAASDYAALAGMSDDAVKKATGCDWARWVRALDRVNAETMSHAELASHIREKYKTPSWWTQTVAVGYERIRGLRARGQRRSGDWTVNKSRTFAVPVAKLYAAFATARQRARWLSGVKLTIGAKTPSKSLRIRWPDGTPVDVRFTPRGQAKAQVAVEHARLASKTDAERTKEFWSERLDVLASVLG